MDIETKVLSLEKRISALELELKSGKEVKVELDGEAIAAQAFRSAIDGIRREAEC